MEVRFWRVDVRRGSEVVRGIGVAIVEHKGFIIERKGEAVGQLFDCLEYSFVLDVARARGRFGHRDQVGDTASARESTFEL
jgi:hypothetical protein